MNTSDPAALKAARVLTAAAIEQYHRARRLLERIDDLAPPRSPAEEWTTLAAIMASAAETAVLQAILAWDPGVPETQLHRGPRTMRKARGVEMDGMMYLALPDPNCDLPEGAGSEDDRHLMTLAVVEAEALHRLAE